MSDLDYNLIEDKVRNTVRIIESKPHRYYIRYLLVKRYAPNAIKQELFRLGLSSPEATNLVAYYLTVLEPVIKKYGLSAYFSDYKNKILRKTPGFVKDLLNYSIHIGPNLDKHAPFCKMVKELEIDALWLSEIYKFHGTADKMPTDEKGERILGSGAAVRGIEKILTHPKRYLVDKLLLENIPDARIIQYCREQYKMPIYEYDLALYKKMFFNIKTHDIEEKIKFLEVEKKSLDTLLKDLDSNVMYADLDIGEKNVIKKQSEQRILELNDNIKTMNMLFSDFAFKVASSDNIDFERMFQDMISRGYKRFCELDTYRDRDVVDPMLKITRLMTSAHDKLDNIKSGVSMGDKHTQSTLLELYKRRTDEIMSEQLIRANKTLIDAGIEPIDETLSPEEIAGIEELGVNFDIKDDEE
jgi:hypothetical protein